MKVVRKNGQNKPLKEETSRPTPNKIIVLLNRDVSELELSPLAIEGLKVANFHTLDDFRNALVSGYIPISLGLKSREEINGLFRKNKLEVPKEWIWRT